MAAPTTKGSDRTARCYLSASSRREDVTHAHVVLGKACDAMEARWSFSDRS